MNRRDLLILGGGALLSPALPYLNPRAMAAGATPKRYLQIFLAGGWDMVLATDPATGAKTTGGGYEPAYYTAADAAYPGAPTTVSGKSNLVIGPGLAPAAAAFAEIPTAFVNGMLIEVTAHELAANYLYSGTLSLSRSREYPAIVATMADKTGGFPAHIILGGPIPLSTTKDHNPPLQSSDADAFVNMLAGPYKSLKDLKPAAIDAAHELLAALNAEHEKKLSATQLAGLSAWSASEGGLGTLYAKRYDQKLGLTDAVRATFNAGAKNDSPGARMAVAFQSLREGISRFVTVNFDGFDTHRNHLKTHLPLMTDFATSLKALVDLLLSTPDPDSPSLKLADTTTVLITSEFVRTPKFNGQAGTDHWQAGTAIVMGRGVKDNVVVGSTDAAGNAQDYAPLAGKIKPDHLAASLLRSMGFTAEADLISTSNLDALLG